MVAPRGVPLPHDGIRHWYKVFSVPAEGALHFVCLSPIWDGHWSHWDGQRSYRCSELAACEGCTKGHQHRWTGYLAGYEKGTRQGEFVAALTPGACLYLERRVIGQGQDLRGLEMRLTRRVPSGGGKPAKNAAVNVELVRRVPVATLKPEFDTLPSVLRMWGIHEQHSARAIRQAETVESRESRVLPWHQSQEMLARLTGGIGRE